MPDSSERTPTAERLRELLVGRTVVSATKADEKEYEWSFAVASGVLTLDDGTVLKMWGNEGCGGCSAGWYELSALNAPGGVITNVEVDEKPDEDYGTCPECKAEGRGWDYDCPHRGWYRVFVVTADERTMLASFDGSDGNGYYGTGWWLRVEAAA